ncbi:hypothetical protein PanWU01x14_026530 [Parasponia andersonii]|uniref:Uncharacterized protein n=1 Tax=Parasponia andersonii TaxID=3476 RepID=A0A2P5DW14_PARAD|nr:hypothetical protein PanWU01x14_026530 [Parasponia andersonii]
MDLRSMTFIGVIDIVGDLQWLLVHVIKVVNVSAIISVIKDNRLSSSHFIELSETKNKSTILSSHSRFFHSHLLDELVEVMDEGRNKLAMAGPRASCQMMSKWTLDGYDQGYIC